MIGEVLEEEAQLLSEAAFRTMVANELGVELDSMLTPEAFVQAGLGAVGGSAVLSTTSEVANYVRRGGKTLDEIGEAAIQAWDIAKNDPDFAQVMSEITDPKVKDLTRSQIRNFPPNIQSLLRKKNARQNFVSEVQILWRRLWNDGFEFVPGRGFVQTAAPKTKVEESEAEDRGETPPPPGTPQPEPMETPDPFPYPYEGGEEGGPEAGGPAAPEGGPEGGPAAPEGQGPTVEIQEPPQPTPAAPEGEPAPAPEGEPAPVPLEPAPAPEGEPAPRPFGACSRP